MDVLSDRDKGFLHLLMRSPDVGDGWRKVSDMLWPLVEQFPHRELLEIDRPQVRLSEKGKTVVDYLS